MALDGSNSTGPISTQGRQACLVASMQGIRPLDTTALLVRSPEAGSTPLELSQMPVMLDALACGRQHILYVTANACTSQEVPASPQGTGLKAVVGGNNRPRNG